MAKTELCSISQPLLEETLKKLADAFNRGLLTDDKPTADEVNEDATDSSADISDDDRGSDDEGDSSRNKESGSYSNGCGHQIFASHSQQD